MKTKSIILVTLLSCVFLIGCNEENEPAMKSETLLGDVVGYENEPDIDNGGNETNRKQMTT